MDAITKARLNKLDERITSSLTGIGDVRLVGNNVLRFTNQNDGSTFDVKLPFDVATIDVVSSLPIPSSTLVDSVYLLLTDNHFYKCIYDMTNSTYVFQNISLTSDGIGIYDDYSLLPINSTKDIIVYVKNDYTDISSGYVYKSGFYLYDVTNKTWILISGNSTSNSDEYTEEIKTKSKIWNIQHNLNTEWWKLHINIIDEFGNITYGDVDLNTTTNNLLVLNFQTDIQGKIHIKK